MYHLYLALSMTLLISWPAQSLNSHNNNLQVAYQYLGEQVLVQGERTANGYLYPNPTAKRELLISTLNWPPYIGETLCKQGWVQQLTVALLHSQGYQIETQFRPWARAVKEVETGESHLLYPEYFIEPDAPSDVHFKTRRLDHLALSNPFPGGTIAFIKRRGQPDNFKGDLHNLERELIGVVRGYQNTPEFDRLMDRDFFRTVEVSDDLQLARLLLGQRVNLIIGDPKVIFYNVSQAEFPQPGLQTGVAELEVVQPALQYNHLYYAISRKADNWQSLLADINLALTEFEQSGELQRLISSTLQYCGTSQPE